jgi:hypothetical protein
MPWVIISIPTKKLTDCIDVIERLFDKARAIEERISVLVVIKTQVSSECEEREPYLSFHAPFISLDNSFNFGVD